jgi:hypothetical protein
MNDLAHAHVCPHCGETRDCSMMHCHGLRLKGCWDCHRRGLVDG